MGQAKPIAAIAAGGAAMDGTTVAGAAVNGAAGDGDVGTTGGRCSICKAPSRVAFRPFCSKRCADVDLARWLGGGYVIPDGGHDSDEDDAQIAGPADGSDDDA